MPEVASLQHAASLHQTLESCLSRNFLCGDVAWQYAQWCQPCKTDTTIDPVPLPAESESCEDLPVFLAAACLSHPCVSWMAAHSRSSCKSPHVSENSSSCQQSIEASLCNSQHLKKGPAHQEACLCLPDQPPEPQNSIPKPLLLIPYTSRLRAYSSVIDVFPVCS